MEGQQEKHGGIELSVKAFKRAVALAPRDPTALLNLTQGYWRLHHPSLTLEFLERTSQVVPNDPFPHLALAELLIDKRRHLDAMPHLKWTRTRIHRDSNLTALFEKSEGRAATAALRAQQAQTLAPTTKPAKHTSVRALLPPQRTPLCHLLWELGLHLLRSCCLSPILLERRPDLSPLRLKPHPDCAVRMKLQTGRVTYR